MSVEYAGSRPSGIFPPWMGPPPTNPDHIAGWLTHNIQMRSTQARNRLSPGEASAMLRDRYPGMHPAEARAVLRQRSAPPAGRASMNGAEAWRVLRRKDARLSTMLRMAGEQW